MTLYEWFQQLWAWSRNTPYWRESVREEANRYRRTPYHHRRLMIR